MFIRVPPNPFHNLNISAATGLAICAALLRSNAVLCLSLPVSKAAFASPTIVYVTEYVRLSINVIVVVMQIISRTVEDVCLVMQNYLYLKLHLELSAEQ